MTTTSTTTTDTTTDTTAAAVSPLLAAALECAGRGWPVFPCTPGSKRPAVKAWNTRATTEEGRIRRCWSSGAFNIGVACGPAGLVVIDCDTAGPGETHPDGRLIPEQAGWSGLDALDELARTRGPRNARGALVTGPIATFTVDTPSGGMHFYYRAPAGRELRNTAGALGWKLDTRAAGGYVLAPGSRLPHGDYRQAWESTGEVSALPQWLAAALEPAAAPPATRTPVATSTGEGRAGRYLDAAIAAEVERVTRAATGTRNRALFIAACALGQLAAGGALTANDVTTVLLDAAAGHVANGAYSQGQARATVASGLRTGANRPRTLTNPDHPTGAVA